MSQVKFISGDGVEHEVEHDSVAADIMRQAGFRVISEEKPVTTIEPDANAVPTPMKRPEIIARAKELGLTFKSNETNAVLLEMIAAAEAAEDEDAE